MFNRRARFYIFKLLSLFSVVRGHNIAIIALAQYLASIYILAPERDLRKVILDPQLFVIVLASTLVIASGYIINNFYDAEKDLINKPTKSMLDRLVSPQFKLNTYFMLNLFAVFAASYISFRAVLFFSAYIFGIWLYSHKLKRIPLMGNLFSAMLAIAPFFAVFVYYKNFDPVIFVHALYLFLLILAREMVKDLENIPGDLAHGYKTVPVIYGTRVSKMLITIVIALTLMPAIVLIRYFTIGQMHWYFIAGVILLLLFVVMLWRAKRKLHYVGLHNILKFVIVAGVFSILLLDIDLVIHRIS